jgi:hypothetical protein
MTSWSDADEVEQVVAAEACTTRRGRRVIRPLSWNAAGSAGVRLPRHSAAQHDAQVTGHGARHITTCRSAMTRAGKGNSTSATGIRQDTSRPVTHQRRRLIGSFCRPAFRFPGSVYWIPLRPPDRSAAKAIAHSYPVAATRMSARSAQSGCAASALPWRAPWSGSPSRASTGAPQGYSVAEAAAGVPWPQWVRPSPQ